MFDRAASSFNWLERHYVTHAGANAFKCIIGKCFRRFNSQQALQRHVNHHFKGISFRHLFFFRVIEVKCLCLAFTNVFKRVRLYVCVSLASEEAVGYKGNCFDPFIHHVSWDWVWLSWSMRVNLVTAIFSFLRKKIVSYL